MPTTEEEAHRETADFLNEAEGSVFDEPLEQESAEDAYVYTQRTVEAEPEQQQTATSNEKIARSTDFFSATLYRFLTNRKTENQFFVDKSKKK